MDQLTKKKFEDGFTFGDPASPFDALDTSLAGGVHNGRTDNIRGSWVEVDITAKDTAVEFVHNLNSPLHGTSERNVRWHYTNLRHDGYGLSTDDMVTGLSASIDTPRWSTVSSSVLSTGLNSTTWTKLAFDTNCNTSGLSYDDANDRIVNQSGASITVLAGYHYSCYSAGTGLNLETAIYLDGSIVAYTTQSNDLGSSTIRTAAANGHITMANNSYIELYGRRASGTGTAYLNPNYSLYATKVSSSSSISATTVSVSNFPMSIEYVAGDAITANSIELQLRAPRRTVSASHPVRVTMFFTSAVRG